MECSLCIEPFNKTTRKQVSCSCLYDACSSCVQRYLLDLTEHAQCMNCHKLWDTEFLTTQLTKSFVNKEYKAHREDVLLQREKSMLPESMPAAEREKQILDVKRIIREYTEEKKDIAADRFVFHDDMGIIERERHRADVDIKVFRRKRDIEFLRYKLSVLEEHEELSNKKTFVRACPFENCKGFLDGDWHCGLCDKNTCKKCHDIIDTEDHECDIEKVETAKLLKKDSKNCPKCAACIFKIDGCDQMWCTQCKTPFSWKSGNIIQGTLHNPHYFEWMRTNNHEIPRNPLDVPGGACDEGMPDISTALRKEKALHKKDKEQFDSILRVINVVNHIAEVDIPAYTLRQIEDRNRDLRVQYILNIIDDDTFKRKLQQREKKENKFNDTRMVLEMFVQSSTDIVRRFCACNNLAEEKNLRKEFRRLKSYAVDHLEKISQRYACKKYEIVQTVAW